LRWLKDNTTEYCVAFLVRRWAEPADAVQHPFASTRQRGYATS